MDEIAVSKEEIRRIAALADDSPTPVRRWILKLLERCAVDDRWRASQCYCEDVIMFGHLQGCRASRRGSRRA